MEQVINICDGLSTKELDIIYIYLNAKLKKVQIIKPKKIYKYKLEYKGKTYDCNTLKEISKITNIHELTIFKLVNGDVRFRNKRSNYLKDIKITKNYRRREDIEKKERIYTKDKPKEIFKVITQEERRERYKKEYEREFPESIEDCILIDCKECNSHNCIKWIKTNEIFCNVCDSL